ncbi:glycoside hydrolase family 57 protein, partial [Candidatus Bathyarchaeota archaeon]|nr:glycoside hydrolase family 57 protein [Candidatus Bathyarchaeota archaeon]
MTDICLVFEVHQPLRLNRNFHHDLLAKPSISKRDLFELYFDNTLNKHIFDRAARKCYLPANRIILEQINNLKDQSRSFKVAFGLSGVFIEQCAKWNQDLLDSFKELAQTGCVEFLEETYYHSLASLFGTDQTEFIEQVNMHKHLMKELFDSEPKIFENTECLYNNAIARTIAELGYKGIITEGVERILDWRSPNYVYKAKGASISVLLRNYRLADDIGFRFSSTWWSQWPLTAKKYASWLAAMPGQAVTLFMDYETFGEHHWPETGIHEFLRWLPRE